MVLVISTDAAAVWSYPVRTLTELTKAAQIIKNKDYANASPEDLIYANLVRSIGLVTTDELAAFINYGVASLGKADMWASIINSNPFSLWPTDDIVSIFNNAYITADSVAKIIRSPYMSADKAQSILYRMADMLYIGKLLNILTYDAVDLSVTANTTLSTGINRYRTLSVASGVTLTVGAEPGVIIADTVTNSGTIASGWVKGAGGAPGSPPGRGGNGAGGIIILARTVTIGTITAKGQPGEAGSTTNVSAAGAPGGAGAFWVISGDTVPSGGRGGGTYGGAGNPNGGGGGSYSISYSGGAGGSATVTTFTNAKALASELLKAAVDWWLVNVLAKTPTTPKSFPSLGGSGGGGGGDYDAYFDSGGGGGGGGEVIVLGITVTAGTIDVSGGAGGAGGAEGAYDSGGGGGGGGVAYVLYKSITGSMTFIVNGSAGGTGKYAGAAGGTGVGRAIQI